MVTALKSLPDKSNIWSWVGIDFFFYLSCDFPDSLYDAWFLWYSWRFLIMFGDYMILYFTTAVTNLDLAWRFWPTIMDWVSNKNLLFRDWQDSFCLLKPMLLELPLVPADARQADGVSPGWGPLWRCSSPLLWAGGEDGKEWRPSRKGEHLTWPLTVRDLPSHSPPGADRPTASLLGAGWAHPGSLCSQSWGRTYQARVPSSVTGGLCAALPCAALQSQGLTLAYPPLPPPRSPLRWFPMLFQGS